MSPTRAAHTGPREFPAAFDHPIRGSLSRQQIHYWRHPPEFGQHDPVSIPLRSPSGAPTAWFGGFGFRVVIGDILEDEGRRVEAEISETGGECLFVTLDVVNEGHWKEAVEAAVQRFGKLDVLVNNAGIFKLANVEETSSELWDEIMGINAKGVFLGTKYAIPEMRKNGAAP